MTAGETTVTLFERYGPAYRWLVTITGLLGAFSMVLSATVANVAVPKVMGAFGVGQDQAQWMATAFLATMTASQLLNAWVTTRLGPRLAYMMTLAVFTVGSFLAATAPNMEMLIVGRVMQGFAAGVVQPLTQVVVFQVFPDHRRGMAMGIYGAGVTLAPGIGPVVGGIVIDAISWRAIFLLPLLPCFFAVIGGMLFMPTRDPRGDRPPFDWIGYGLLCLALVCILTAIARGPIEGWRSNQIVLEAVIGVGAAIAFAIWQTRTRAPLLAVDLLRNPVFVSALFVALVFGAGNFGSSYLIPVFVQEVQGYTPTLAGLVLLPAGILLTASLPVMGRISDRLPGYVMIMCGLFCFALGSLLMMLGDVNTSFWVIAFYACVTRFGLAFILPSLSATALKALSTQELAKGSGNLNFFRQLGGAVGTNVIVVWLQMRTNLHSDWLTATQTPGNETSLALLADVMQRLAEVGAPEAVRQGLALDFLGRVVWAQASTFGFQDAFLALAVVFLLALIPAWILGRAGRRAPAPAPTGGD